MMAPLVLVAIGLAIGVVIGAAIAAVTLLEKPWHWTTVIRLDQETHERLKKAARRHYQPLKREILDRLNRDGGKS
jgi:hypothetical protein